MTNRLALALEDEIVSCEYAIIAADAIGASDKADYYRGLIVEYQRELDRDA